MIDLLHMHGTEAIKHGANGQKTTEVQLNTSGDLYEEPDNSEQASKLVAFLTAFLDSQVGICFILWQCKFGGESLIDRMKDSFFVKGINNEKFNL